MSNRNYYHALTGVRWALLAVVSMCGTAKAADESRTQKDFVAEYRAFDRQFALDAYKQIGHHDPKWDDDVIVLITAVTGSQTLSTSHRSTSVPKWRSG
jgi:hypothetical protein